MEMIASAHEERKVATFDAKRPGTWGHKAKHKAGIALLRRTRQGSEVLLVQQANGRWSLPKGKRKAGETVRQTCLRECQEETGYAVQALQFVGWGVNCRKHVRFYLWKSTVDYPWPTAATQPGPGQGEIRAMAWKALAKARQMLKPWQANLLAKITG